MAARSSPWCCPTPRCDRRSPSPTISAAPSWRRNPRPRHDFGRRLDAETRRRQRFADRTRRRLSLCRQTQRPQPGGLRSRPGIYGRDARPGRVTTCPQRAGFPRLVFDAGAANGFFATAPRAFLGTAFVVAACFVSPLFLAPLAGFGGFGRFLIAARCAAPSAALAQSESSSGSSKSRAGNSQYEFTVTVLTRVWYWNGFDPSASNRAIVCSSARR